MKLDSKLSYSGIYTIINLYSGRTYVGSAINIYTRWRIHIDELKAHKHGNVYLQAAFKKHGLIGLVFSVVERVEDRSTLYAREQFYMDKFRSVVPNGYNINPIAGSRLGTKHSVETRAKLSAARQKRITKDETRLKLSIAHTNRIMTAEHKSNLSKASKGVPKSDAHRKAMSIERRNRSMAKFQASMGNSFPIVITNEH